MPSRPGTRQPGAEDRRAESSPLTPKGRGFGSPYCRGGWSVFGGNPRGLPPSGTSGLRFGIWVVAGRSPLRYDRTRYLLLPAYRRPARHTFLFFSWGGRRQRRAGSSACGSLPSPDWYHVHLASQQVFVLEKATEILSARGKQQLWRPLKLQISEEQLLGARVTRFPVIRIGCCCVGLRAAVPCAWAGCGDGARAEKESTWAVGGGRGRGGVLDIVHQGLRRGSAQNTSYLCGQP